MQPVDPAQLSSERRMQLATLSGTAQRWGIGALRDRPLDEAVAALHEITRDPLVLGVALGNAMAGVELDGYASYARLVEMFRAAGADEDVAAAHLQWLRGRPR